MRFCFAVMACLVLAVTALAADVGGKWNFVFQTEAGERAALITLAVDEGAVTGTMGEASDTGSESGGIAVKGTYEDGELVLSFPYYSADAGFQAELQLQGSLQEDKIAGSWTFNEYTGTFEATRQ